VLKVERCLKSNSFQVFHHNIKPNIPPCFDEMPDEMPEMNLISDTFLLLAHWNIAENFKKVKKQVRTSKL